MRIGVLILPAERWTTASDSWRFVDDAGFAHVWTYDHIAWRGMLDQPWFAAIPTLTAVAASTRQVEIGTLVASINFRHPVTLAKEAITLDDISGGRFVLGVGSGTRGVDSSVLGQPEWTSTERGARLSEFVELIELLLTQPVTSYRGRYYQATEARMLPGCVRRPRLPIALAATGPQGMRLAARHADIWVTGGPPIRPSSSGIGPQLTIDIATEQVRRFEAACAAEDRDPRDMRMLLLNARNAEPPLSSVDSFLRQVEEYRRLGFTDMVIPFPRAEPPFQAEFAVLERIADRLADI